MRTLPPHPSRKSSCSPLRSFSQVGLKLTAAVRSSSTPEYPNAAPDLHPSSRGVVALVPVPRTGMSLGHSHSACRGRPMFPLRLIACGVLAMPLLLSPVRTLAEESVPTQTDHEHQDHHEHAAPAPAQIDHEHHGQHEHPAPGSSKPETPAEKPRKPSATPHAGRKKPAATTHAHHNKPTDMEHGGTHDVHQGHQTMEMQGFLGPYPMSREGSGTSWLPDSTPHEGVHQTYGDWMLMEHALVNAVYDHQGGPRGGDKAFVGGMIMGMAQRTLGEDTLGLKVMLSPDPFMGPSGYPLLLATGETADGRTPLIDRQHPHDLFMELSGSYSHKLSPNSSVFVYAGLPGDPALGPTAFMHRTSGMDIPEAPITHHWLDSTHITFGVVTIGAVWDTWKLEASAFRGREPDQHRFDIEEPRLDSVSARLTWNPFRELSAQVSWGRIHSPDQLEPDVDEDRITASATYTQPFGDDNLWSSTFAWGRKILHPGEAFDAFLMESALILQKRYTLFLRAERIDAHDLLHDMPNIDPVLSHASFPVMKLSVGGIYDIPLVDHLKFGIGGLVSKYGVPAGLTPFYGSDPTSYMV